MDMSESIKELTAALAKAQGQFQAVPKTGRNTFLNSSYVQLDDIIAAIRGPLSQNGIAWTQPLTGNGDGLVLETLLLHESGEWMSCSAPIQAQETKGLSNLQSFGVALSYMRRYMLTTMLGINSGDDTDGNDDKKPAKKAARKPAAKKAAKKPAAAGHDNGAVGYEGKDPKDVMHQAMADAIAPKAFDPLNPDWSLVQSWDHFMDTVAHYVEHYNHAAHVKNALNKIYPDPDAKTGLTYQVAWTALIDHANVPKEEVPA